MLRKTWAKLGHSIWENGTFSTDFTFLFFPNYHNEILRYISITLSSQNMSSLWSIQSTCPLFNLKDKNFGFTYLSWPSLKLTTACAFNFQVPLEWYFSKVRMWFIRHKWSKTENYLLGQAGTWLSATSDMFRQKTFFAARWYTIFLRYFSVKSSMNTKDHQTASFESMQISILLVVMVKQRQTETYIIM